MPEDYGNATDVCFVYGISGLCGTECPDYLVKGRACFEGWQTTPALPGDDDTAALLTWAGSGPEASPPEALAQMREAGKR